MSTDAPQIAAFRYAREDVLGPKGLDNWRDLMGRTVLGLDLDLLSDQFFHSEVATRFMPGLRITFASKAGLRMRRSRPLLVDGNDNLSLHICTGGEWAVAHRSREAPLHTGEAVLISDAEAASVTCWSPSECICVQIDRQALAPMVPHFGDALARPIRQDNDALRLLIGYLRALGPSEPVRSPAVRKTVAAHIRDLVVAALGASGDCAVIAEQGVRAARLRAVKANIEKHVTEPDLSLTTVAVHQGISPRYVQALFEDEGTTFSAFVLGRRLACAHRLLSSPRHMDRRIADIAFSVGFGDLSYFNRAFRRQYGLTPSDARAQALLDSPAEPGSEILPS